MKAESFLEKIRVQLLFEQSNICGCGLIKWIKSASISSIRRKTDYVATQLKNEFWSTLNTIILRKRKKNASGANKRFKTALQTES